MIDEFEKDYPHKIHEKSYIICSAIYVLNDKIYKAQPRNIKEGFVITGRRHSDCYNTLICLNYDINKNFEDIQGFLTSNNRFVDRKEAYNIALECGQIEERENKLLISEDLY